MATRWRVHFPVLLLLIAIFALAAFQIERESVTAGEAVTLWTVRDVQTVEGGSLGETARALLANTRSVIDRAREGLAGPLYPLLLEGWTWLVGESPFAVRVFSLLWMLLGLSVVYDLLTHFHNPRRAAFAGILLLGTNIVVLYAARDAEAHALLFALATLATYAFIRWLETPSPRWTLAYALALAAALYAHQVALIVVAAHAAWQARRVLLASRRDGLPIANAAENAHLLRWLVGAGLAIALYLPWTFLADRDPAFDPRLSEDALLALVLVASPLLAWAVAVIVARIPRGRGALVVVGLLAIAQFAVYPLLVPPSLNWPDAIIALDDIRTPDEPALFALPPYSVGGYYDHVYNLRRGMAIDLSWRDFTPDEINTAVAQVTASGGPVWVMAPTTGDLSTQLTASVSAERGVTDCIVIGDVVLARYAVGGEGEETEC